MVAVTEICPTPDVAEIVGCRRTTLQNRIREGVILPVLKSAGKSHVQYFSFREVLGLRKYEEMRQIGVSEAAAKEAIRVIAQIDDIDAQVESGRHYLVITLGNVYPTALTATGVQTFIADWRALVAEHAADKPVENFAVFVVDFGMTWKLLKPMLQERAAAACGGRTAGE